MFKSNFRQLLIAALVLLQSFVSLPAFSQQNGNLSSIILPSAARTAASVLSSDITNPQWRGGHFIVNISAYTSGSYVVTVQGKDPVSSNYYDILVGSAITATGTTVLKVYPGIATIAGGAASDTLPRVFRVKVAASATPVATYSIGAFLEQ